jgi:hypothetical protein
MANSEIDPIRSEYFDAAKRHLAISNSRLREVLSRKNVLDLDPDEDQVELWKKLALGAVENIHRQAAKNMTRWTSCERPGVSEVHTSVRVLDILSGVGEAGIAQSARNVDREQVQTERWLVFSSTPNALFPTDGGPMTAFDIAMDRALRVLPGVRYSVENGSAKDVEITLMGSPLSLGGTVSDEWIQQVDSESWFVAQARLHAEYIKEKLADSDDVIYLTGQSMGGLMAMITARLLPEEMQRRVRVLADNPDPVHGKGQQEKDAGFNKLVAGVIKELDAMWERREDVWAKTYIADEQKRVMKQGGIWIEESNDQRQLKQKGLKRAWKNLEQGPGDYLESFYPEHAQVYIRQGIYDQTRVEKDDLVDYLNRPDLKKGLGGVWSKPENRPNVRQWGFSGRHEMRRHNYDYRWILAARALEE